MRKFLFKFFLSLNILLLGWYCQLYANASANSSHHSSATSSETLNESADEQHDEAPLMIRPDSRDPKKEILKVEATEAKEEEDEHDSSSSLKKTLKYFSIILFTHAPESLFRCSIKISPFCKFFSSTSSHRYLIFRVFRI